jgi:hypothetical protein
MLMMLTLMARDDDDERKLFSFLSTFYVRYDGSQEHSRLKAATLKHKTTRHYSAKEKAEDERGKKKKRNLIEMALSRYARDALCRVSLNDTRGGRANDIVWSGEGAVKRATQKNDKRTG